MQKPEFLKKLWKRKFFRWPVVVVVAFCVFVSVRVTIKYPDFIFLRICHIGKIIEKFKEITKVPDKFVGKPAIDFTAEDLSGKRIVLSDFKGKPVFLTFFAYW